MLPLDENLTIGAAFAEAAQRYAHLPMLAVPANPARGYAPEGLEWRYAEVAARVAELSGAYARAGYGVGHRVALLMENQPEHLLHKLAMNTLGICCVPLNPDHRPAEMAYVIDHSQADLVIAIDSLRPLVRDALALASHQPAVITEGAAAPSLPSAQRPAERADVRAGDIASVLYTSGTTAKPKGCLLSHRYELAAGQWYATRGGLVQFAEGSERIYNPLPLFHVNSSVFSFWCAVLRGNCQIQASRFQPTRWLQELHASGATVAHYLGVMVPMLLNQPPHPLDRDHRVRFAIGAGVDPQRHAEFEQRFGYPLIEIWGMTEMVRAIFDADPPRRVGTRAIGRTQPGVEVRLVDDAGHDVPDGSPGEMLVRHSAATPRKDFFSGYLDDEAATAQAWHGGWFHTGDVVMRDDDGLLHFLERRKNIIRRSGENIAAAEVEAVLQTHSAVHQAVVMAVPDEVREQEVLACVVLKSEWQTQPTEALMQALFDHCNQSLAYFKAPGWIWLTNEIPTTGTQKIQKHQIFGNNTDPRTTPGMVDMRAWKKR